MITVLQGDCREVLQRLPAASVQTCVTSPPYWNLRDYQTGQWEGGAPDCDHSIHRNSGASTLGLAKGQASHEAAMRRESAVVVPYRDVCGKCGAQRIDRQIGLEPTVEAYVDVLVQVFHEVQRVLRDTGTLWLNLGDAYASSGTSGYQNLDKLGERLGTGGGHKHSAQLCGRAPTPHGIKAKDLIGLPWLVAFALRADGWYLRSDIVWSKPNCMPESVTDRPTRSHEYIFLLSKQERYYYDADAIREHTGNEMSWNDYAERTAPGATWKSGGITKYAGANKHDGGHAHPAGRNKRSVWAVSTQSYPGAHYATFPEKLIEPCILAGSRSGDTVLDPFAGSGTTGRVALKHGRDAVLIELNPDYIEQVEARINGVQTSLLLEAR